MEAALSDEQRLLLQEPGELGSLAGSNMPELNPVISLQDVAPSTLVDGAPSDVSEEDVPDSTRQGSPSFNSLSMQDDQSPKGGDHQPQIFDGNIDLSFLENEEGNVTGGISDSSVAEAPNSQLLDFEPSSFGTPLMEVSKSAFPTMHQGHLEPASSDEPYLNRANSGQSIVQSVYSTFDPLHGNSTNAAQTRSSSVNPPLPIPTQMGMIPTNEMVPPFSMGNGTPNQFNSQSQEDTFQSELFLPPPVLPFNQSSISFNDQVGQNNVINNSIQQTTQFPASYPQNMTTMGNLEGTPSWINQYELFPNHNTPPGPLTPSRYQPNQLMAANFFDSQCTNPMLPGPSMPSRHQHLTNYQLRLSDQVPGMLSGPQPPMNRRPQQRPYLFNQVQITPNVCDPRGSTMLPDSCLNLRSPQFPSHNLQVSGEHDVLNSQCYNSMLFGPTASSRHPNSFIHQHHPGHVYMKPNAATAQQYGGFNQSGPSSLAPWVQFFSNQVQVNQAAVMPNIDNMQQENFMPWNFGSSTRSQMDSLHVQGLLSQAARPNASNLGLDTSLNSQIMGLDHTQQQNKGKSTEVFSHHHPDMVSMLNNHNENMILGSRGRGNSHFIIGETSSSKRQRTEWTPSHKVQESMNASSLGSRVAKNDIYDPLFEGIGLQIDPHLRMLALM